MFYSKKDKKSSSRAASLKRSRNVFLFHTFIYIFILLTVYPDLAKSTDFSNSEQCSLVTLYSFLIISMALMLFFVWRSKKRKTVLVKISEQEQTAKATAETLTVQNEELLGNIKTVKKNIRAVGHNLKTPLTLIDMSFKKLIAETENVTKGNQEKDLLSVAKLQASIQCHVTHMDDMLTYALFPDSAPDLSDYPCAPLTEDIHAFLELFRTASMNQEIDYHITIDSLYIKINKTGLKTILLNLVTNAIRYTPNRGRVSVYIGLEKQDSPDQHSLKMIIEDNGIGIPKKLQNDIFKHGIQTAAARLMSQKGKGQGLAIVAEQIRLCKGDIALESKLNHGSKFTVTLPCIICKTDDD